jgi:hypothetical protein
VFTDISIITFERIHALWNGSTNAGKFYTFKLDLMKVYDRIDWYVLEIAFKKIGFGEKIIC